MSALRACLLSTALAAGGWAYAQAQGQALPQDLSRSGDVVMMQPIPDGATGGTGLSGPRPSRLRVLSPADHDIFVRAFDAASRGDWTAARTLAAQGQNATARRLLQWRYALDRNSGATFAEIDAVIRDTESRTAAGAWPLRGTLQARAEMAMTPDVVSGMGAGAIVTWFGGRPPNTSIGKVRLGEALVATGERTRGAALIRAGWAEGSFDPVIEQAIIQQDGAWLTPESDRARLDNLLWRGEITAARRQIMRVDAATAAVANARIALASGLPRAQAAVDRVRDSTDPGLLFDWSRALRLAERDNEAHAMLLRIPAAVMVKDHLARWWGECNIQARDALAAADPRTALALVQHAGLSAGDQYVEQQFLAGFIALRFLKDPASALAHFERLDAAVTRPISKSRAQYWLGRAYEAMGEDARALAHYKQAAAYPETFYGQIALAHTDPSPVLHLSETPVEAVPAADVDADALMPEIKVLADLGQAGSLRAFVTRDAETYPAPRHIKRLILLLNDWGYPEIGVRLAKTASYDGTYMPAYTHPLIALPRYPGPGEAPDPALVLGLIRQETEFDAYAVSGAGARGLMQMMPNSAKIAARAAGLPYRPEALLSDTTYNMQLGMTEYRGHLDRYGGSWVLAAAAYNAGPTNARKWLASNGDPRSSGVDPIDWIEQIPFGETRNYVQRVLENTEVYRARLAGRDVPLKILADLYAPLAPSMPVLTVRN
ncbi:MAG TPA: lytic transglycosylase domain-containing protein [Rhizomicrobium sp.]|nr:lytic transglycosylase domain-containing protein [Rhizomicrobium sp.]